MRLGEVLCLTHADWHPGSGGTPFIEVVAREHPHGARVKGGRGRRIYVSDELERLYGDYLWDLAERAGRAGLEVSDKWFCLVNLDGELRFAPMRPDAPRCAPMRPDAPRCAPMRPERVYRITGRLRHTHASASLNAGGPIHVVQRYMAHVPRIWLRLSRGLAAGL